MTKEELKAIHDDIDGTSIPEEMKLMYLAASAVQGIVEHVYSRIQSAYLRHGYICKENEMLKGLNDYCKTVKRASNLFYAKINPQIEDATFGIGREDGEDGCVYAYDSFNSAACELVRLMMLHLNGTANDKTAYAQVFKMLRKLPSKGLFTDKDISHFKFKA